MPRTRTPHLPDGTLVRGRLSGRLGRVQYYHDRYARGLFPVTFQDGITERCGADDVIVLGKKNARSAAA